MQCFGITDCGKRRGSNQDAFRVKIAGNLLIATVCDGMGGANGGNVASTMAVELYTRKLANYISAALNFVFGGDVPEFGAPCPKTGALCQYLQNYHPSFKHRLYVSLEKGW